MPLNIQSQHAISDQHLISDSPLILQDILDDAHNLTIWQRVAPFDAADLVGNEDAAARVTIALDSIAVTLNTALVEGGFPEGMALQNLITDIEKLCALYQPIADTPKLEVRLEVVSGNACRKFHGDYVKNRLITSYKGSGTQWLDRDDASRVQQGDEPQTIHQLSCGDVGIFKGRLATDHPAIHRSPPIAGSGERRLVLAIDPVPSQNI
jgi:hypothetical protein